MNQGVADVQLVCCSISKIMIQVICRDSPVNSVTIKGGIEITVCVVIVDKAGDAANLLI